ncbi:hypothetical protein ACHAW5_002328, partial [Stephanodiscus triporus]
VVAVLRR